MPEAARYELRSFGSTDRGPRDTNEDEWYSDDQRGIYFVVDGMGGYSAGEHAAAIAKQRLIGRLERPTGTAEQRLREAIALASNAIYEAAESHPEWHGMACVLTVAIVENGRVTVGHVGDSRLYRVTATGLAKATRDHSPVGELEDSGEIGENEAMHHPRRNEVYRDVGSQPHQPDDPSFVDIYEFPLEPGTALLLCSDGLSDALSGRQIRTIIKSNEGNGAAIVNELVRRAAAEGKDNVTAVYVATQAAESKAPKRARRTGAGEAANGSKRTRRNGTAAAAIEPRKQAPETRGAVSPAVPEPLIIVETQSRWLRFGIPVLCILAGIAGTLAVEYATGGGPFRARRTNTAPHRIHVQPAAQDGLISAAIMSAAPGDTVELAPGEYRDEVQLRDGISLTGAGAILRPPPSSPSSGTGIAADGVSHASINGLKIAAGPDGGFAVGIAVRGGSVDLESLDVSGAQEAGIEFSGAASGSILLCSIHDNGGPGIVVRESAAPLIEKNQITDNGRKGARAPGIRIASDGAVRIVGNTMFNNGAEAIWQPGPASAELLNRNIFGRNGAVGRPRDVRVVALPETRP